MLNVAPGTPKPIGQKRGNQVPWTFDATNNTYTFTVGGLLPSAYGVLNGPWPIYIFFPADWGQTTGQDTVLGQSPLGSGGNRCLPTIYPRGIDGNDPTMLLYSCTTTLSAGPNCANGCSYEIDVVDKFSNTLRITGTLMH